ncbi:MAG: S26 family signal peptidase, partial [Microthrixaceae bacterium]
MTEQPLDSNQTSRSIEDGKTPASAESPIQPVRLQPESAINKKSIARRQRAASLRNLIEWVAVVVGAVIVAVLIKTFLVQAFRIPSESMVPTLEIG